MAYTTINKSTDHFNTKLYTGSGSAGHSITGVGFQPDWTWIKSRSGTHNSANHRIYDAVRGVTKVIYSNLTNAEGTDAQGLTAFGTDGFTLGTENQSNGSSTEFVSWNWKAGGAGSSNSDGSITSTVSANTTAGFSIVKYTGNLTSNTYSTVGHGLGSAPKMVIIKSMSDAEHWGVQHTGLSSQNMINLSSTGAQTDTSSSGTLSAPTSSVFSINYKGEWGNNGQEYIAYCFAEKTGYSKFGSYTGNGNADGIFLYTGFKPSWVMIKNRSTSNDWYLFDNSRDTLSPNNPVGRKSLYANTSGAEVTRTTKDMDFVSNGIKLRTADGSQNNNNENYIFMAFGQSLVGNNNVPCTAR